MSSTTANGNEKVIFAAAGLRLITLLPKVLNPSSLIKNSLLKIVLAGTVVVAR